MSDMDDRLARANEQREFLRSFDHIRTAPVTPAEQEESNQ